MKQKKYIYILLVLLIVPLFIFNIICIYKTWYLKGIISTDINEYTDGTMTKYEGGEQALIFFPQYSNLQNDEKVEFYYLDNRPKDNFYHKYQCIFILDVEYSTIDKYISVRDYNTEKMDNNSISDYTCLFEKYDYENNCVKGIYCNDNKHVIRYVFIYGEFKGIEDINSLILWNSSTLW